MNSASLCSLAGRYDNPIPIRFLAPIDCLKIPALSANVAFFPHRLSSLFSVIVLGLLGYPFNKVFPMTPMIAQCACAVSAIFSTRIYVFF